ncbi:hypothetical protein HHI36_005179 [Cryptolaemus montrouzieri]|uniref:Carboxylesterase type B domain-containing protein n=1 Tax=Cryptolaemus montrouzieri TaxID=559131 RepID=A0ABD2NTB3_9CUCU
MSYITSSLTIIITFISFESAAAYSQDYNYSPFTKRYTQKIKLKQGYIQGVVISPKMNSDLPKIEHYRGVPYAAPPVGDLRFMPPRDAPSWEDVKYADNFGPVCPQKFPDIKNMPPKRKKEFLLLREYLLNESEDCLYLNIYTPHDRE